MGSISDTSSNRVYPTSQGLKDKKKIQMEKENLRLYLQITKAKPSVATTPKYKVRDSSIKKLKLNLGSRVEKQLRIRNRSDRILNLKSGCPPGCKCRYHKSKKPFDAESRAKINTLN